MREAFKMYQMLKSNPFTAPYIGKVLLVLGVLFGVGFLWGVVVALIADRLF